MRSRAHRSLRTCLVGAFFALALAGSHCLIWAAPTALRAPISQKQGALALEYGPGLSLGAWLSEHWGAALHLDASVSGGSFAATAAGASFAAKFRLFGQPKGWRMDALLGAGLLYQILEPGIGATAHLALQLNYESRIAIFSVGLVSPMAFQFMPEGLARIPALLELWLLFRAGVFWFGLQTHAGIAVVPGQTLTADCKASLVFSLVWEELR